MEKDTMLIMRGIAMKERIVCYSLVLPLAFIVCLMSCGEARMKWSGSIEEVEGITVVENPREPLYPPEALTLEADLSIGVPDGDEEYTFNEIRHALVDDLGRIFILDWRDCVIKVFDPEGVYLKTIGKKGEGPGELNRPSALSLNRDTLMVLELNRISFFDLEGEFQRSVSPKGVWALRARMNSSGDLFVTSAVVDPEDPHYQLQKFDGDMNHLCDLAKSPAPNPLKGFNPFMPISYWIIDDSDNVVYGYPEEYLLQVFDSSGNLTKKIYKEYDPIPITNEEKDERTQDAPPSIKFVFSEHHSAFRRLFHDDEGRVYVQTWEKAGEKIFFYDVFDADGKFIVKISLRDTPMVCRGSSLYTLEEDEAGYQSVKRYRMNWRF
jgi:hypothetical protein